MRVLTINTTELNKNARISKTLPTGEVDHVTLNFTTDPSVYVVVTVHAALKDGQQFTTTFSGPDNLVKVSEWKPANYTDNKYTALFVLPAAINKASTIVR